MQFLFCDIWPLFVGGIEIWFIFRNSFFSFFVTFLGGDEVTNEPAKFSE
jgi:hypothetical protein